MVYIYMNAQLWLNFIFMILVTSFNFEVQIIYMQWFKKNSKWMKSYMLLLLILYVIPIFKQSMYTIACKHHDVYFICECLKYSGHMCNPFGPTYALLKMCWKETLFFILFGNWKGYAFSIWLISLVNNFLVDARTRLITNHLVMSIEEIIHRWYDFGIVYMHMDFVFLEC